jgi:hypothetical protein
VEGDIDLRGFFGIDERIRPGFTRIRLFVASRGPETDERYQQLVDAVNVHCPVIDIVSIPVPIDREVKFS